MTAPITWADATSPIYWSNIGINWNSPAKGESTSYSITNDYSSVSRLDAVGSALYTVNNGFTSTNSFLWNDLSDPSNTWSLVSDPTTIWSDVNDPTTIWTKVDYPD